MMCQMTGSETGSAIQVESIGSHDGQHEQILKRMKSFFAINIGRAGAPIRDVKFWVAASVEGRIQEIALSNHQP